MPTCKSCNVSSSIEPPGVISASEASDSLSLRRRFFLFFKNVANGLKEQTPMMHYEETLNEGIAINY
jgi:hypothetical protein